MADVSTTAEIGQESCEDFSELDSVLAVDKEAAHGYQRLAVETVGVNPKQLWELQKQQQAADTGTHWLSFADKSILGLPVLAEGSRFTRHWQQMMTVIDLSYTTFYIPFTLAVFDRYTFDSCRAVVLYCLDLLMGVVFVANLLLQYHVPVRVSAMFYQLVVRNGRGIQHLYRTKGTFWIDIATALPLVLLVVAPFLSSGQAHGLINIMLVARLIRLVRVVHLVQQLARGQVGLHTKRWFLSLSTWYLISLLYCGLALINLLACVWYAVGRTTGPTGWQPATSSWLESVGGDDYTGASAYMQYLAAVYFTVTTLTTTGYGDITAHSNLEMVVAIIMQLTGVLFVSFVFGTVTALINQGSAEARRNTAFLAKVPHLDRFFRMNAVPRAIGQEIYSYYYYIWSRCQLESDEWSEVLDDLPPAIRGRLVSAVLDRSCRQLMAKLGAGVPEAVLLLFCSGLERLVLSPGASLADIGASVDRLWLLRHGRVLALQPEALTASAGGALMATAGRIRSNQSTAQQRQQRNSQQQHLAQGSQCQKQEQQQSFGQQAAAGPQQQHTTVFIPSAVDAATTSHDTELDTPSTAAMVGKSNLQKHCSEAPQHDDDTSHSGEDASRELHAEQWHQHAHAEPDQSVQHMSLHMQRVEFKRRLEQQGRLRTISGPCWLPDYALTGRYPGLKDDAGRADHQSGPSDHLQQQEPLSTSVQHLQRVQQLTHPVQIITDVLCVVYSIDLAQADKLFRLCPRLHANLCQLLEPLNPS